MSRHDTPGPRLQRRRKTPPLQLAPESSPPVRVAPLRECASLADASRIIHELRTHQIELEMENEELRRTQEALAVRQEHYQDFYDFAPVGYLTLNRSGVILEANRTLATLLGVSKPLLLGQLLHQFIVPADQDRFYLYRKKFFMAESSAALEVQIMGKASPPFWARLAASTSRKCKHGLAGTAHLMIWDITERKLAEEALRGQEFRHLTILQTAMDGFWRLDNQGRLLEVNAAYCRMSGYSEEELLTMDISSLEAQETAAETAAHMQKVFAQGEDRFESRHRRKDGSSYPIEISVQYKAQDNGELIAFLRDITLRKQAEETMRRVNELQHQTILKTAMDGFWRVALDGYLREVNDEYCRMSGYSRQELLTMRVSDLAADPTVADPPLHLPRIMASGSVRFETEHRRKDGTLLAVEISAHYNGSKDRGVFFFLRDITARRQAEAAIREREEKYRTLFDSAGDPILIHNQEGRILAANARASEHYGYSQAEFASIDITELVTPEQVIHIQARMAELRARGTIQFESRHRRKDGTTLTVEVNGRLIDWGNDPAVVLSICRDITSRKKEEETLRAAIAAASHRERENQWLLDASRVVMEGNNFQETVCRLFHAYRTITGASAGYFVLFKDNGQEHELLCLASGDQPATADPYLPLLVRRLQSEVSCQARVIYDNDFMANPWRREIPSSLTIDNVMLAPLIFDGLVWGVFGLANKAGGFTEAEAKIAGALSNMVATALRRMWSDEALRASEISLQRRNEELRISNENLEARVAERTACLLQRTAQLQALTVQLARAEEGERRRIGEMLHDQLQQSLVAAILHLGYQRNKNEAQPGISSMLNKIEGFLVDCLNSSRLLTAELSPTVLYQPGLKPILRQLQVWGLEKFGLRVEMVLGDELEEEREEIRFALYQAIRELLFNVVKHAQVKHAVLSLDRSANGVLRVQVEDHGVGFDPSLVRSQEGTTGGFGLFSLRERLELLGARFTIKSARGQGSCITIIIPQNASRRATPVSTKNLTSSGYSARIIPPPS